MLAIIVPQAKVSLLLVKRIVLHVFQDIIQVLALPRVACVQKGNFNPPQLKVTAPPAHLALNLLQEVQVALRALLDILVIVQQICFV